MTIGTYVSYPSGSGSGSITVPTAADLPTGVADGSTAVTLDTHAFYIYDAGTTTWILQTASTGIAGPGISVDNQIMLFSGTGGNTAKAATGSGAVFATGSGVYNAGIITIPFLMQESADFTTGGYLFAETGNNTGLTSPSDGVLRFYGNGAIAAEMRGNYGISQINTVDYTWPNTQAGAAGYVLTNDGGGLLTWSPPAPPAFPLVSPESADYTTGGYLFSESGNDTGFTSPSDGVIYQWGNAQIGMKLEYIGPTEIRGVPIQFPSVQGNTGDVLTNSDGAGTLTWAPPTSTPTGPAYDIAGYNGSGNLAFIPNWTYDQNIDGLQHNGNSASVNDTFFVRDNSTYTTMTQSYSGFEVRNAIGTITNNYNGFTDNSTITHAMQDVRSFGVANVWSQVDGQVLQFLAQPTITLANGSVYAFSDNTNVGDLPTLNTGYISLNFGPSVATAGGTKTWGFTTFSTHPQVGTVMYDFSAWEDGSSVALVNRNVNYVNFHPTFTEVVDNYNAISNNPHVITHHGSFTDVLLNSQIDSIANNYSGVSIQPRVTEAAPAAEDFTVTPQADVAGSMTGAYFTIGIPYAVGGDNFTPWLKVSGSGSAPGGQPNPIEVDVATNDTAATIATAIYNAVLAYGAPLSTNMTFTDLGGAVQFVANTPGAANKVNTQGNPFLFTYTYATYGAGGGGATGLSIDMTQANNFGAGQVRVANLKGGSFHGEYQRPITDNGGQPVSINDYTTQLTAAASATIANADSFGFATTQFINLGAGATITSGSFGLGAAAGAGLNLMTLDAGASIQDVAGNLSAFVLLPGAGGGTVGTVHGYETVGLPGFVTGSTSTITNAKAFEARAPAGPFTTSTAWGVYLGAGWDQNFMAGSLKIGNGGGDTATYHLDIVSNDSVVTARIQSTANEAKLLLDGDSFGTIENNTGPLTVKTNGSAPIVFSPFGTEVMRVIDGGTVAIGTTTPVAAAHLQVRTDTDENFVVRPGSLIGVTGYLLDSVNDADSAVEGVTIRGNPTDIRDAGLTSRIYVASGGNVGISTNSPANALSVNGIMDVVGAVGIGTTTPGVYGAKLVVHAATDSNFLFRPATDLGLPDGAFFDSVNDANSSVKPLAFRGNDIGFYGADNSLKLAINSTGIGAFNTTPVAQQASSGPQTAGAIYTSTEQTMLQQVYDAMRAYGLLS